MTFHIFQLQEAKKKGVKKGVYRDYIVQVRSRKDGKPVSQKAAEHIKKVAKAQASVEARATPDSQEGESVSPSPFAEVAAIHAEIGTPDRAGRVQVLALEPDPLSSSLLPEVAGPRATHLHPLGRLNMRGSKRTGCRRASWSSQSVKPG